jgi:hypothetical protein
MKKTIAKVGVTCMSLLTLSVHAQQTWDAKKNPTVALSYQNMKGNPLHRGPELTTAIFSPLSGNMNQQRMPMQLP